MIPNNVRAVRITAAAGTYLARASFEALSNPKAFIPSDSGLQPKGLRPARGVAPSGFRPLWKILTAAIRRCPGSVSVPVVGAMLSHPLGIFVLVSRYLTN